MANMHHNHDTNTLTPKQAAQRLNLTTPEVMDWVREGRLPVIEQRGPNGIEYRIPQDAVEAAYRGLPWADRQPSRRRPSWRNHRLARRAFVTLAATSGAAAAGVYATRWFPDSGSSSPTASNLTTPTDDNAEPDSLLGDESASVAAASTSTPTTDTPIEPSIPRIDMPALNLDDLIHGGVGLDGINLAGPGIVPAVDNPTDWEIFIPTAQLRASVVGLGLTPTRALGAPDNPDVIGWWQDGPTPGATGNVLLDGHRDFTDIEGNVGFGVNWLLPDVAPDDLILIADHNAQQTFVYAISDAFGVTVDDPNAARFLQGSNLPILTLITCEGSFDKSSHAYANRRIVIALLQGIAHGTPT
jgi:excisionase family DNA binding protein